MCIQHCYTLKGLKRLVGQSLSRSPQSGKRNVFQTYEVISNILKQCIIVSILGAAEGLFRHGRGEETTASREKILEQ